MGKLSFEFWKGTSLPIKGVEKFFRYSLLISCKIRNQEDYQSILSGEQDGLLFELSNEPKKIGAQVPQIGFLRGLSNETESEAKVQKQILSIDRKLIDALDIEPILLSIMTKISTDILYQWEQALEGSQFLVASSNSHTLMPFLEFIFLGRNLRIIINPRTGKSSFQFEDSLASKGLVKDVLSELEVSLNSDPLSIIAALSKLQLAVFFVNKGFPSNHSNDVHAIGL
jgi:hypothetical protein